MTCTPIADIVKKIQQVYDDGFSQHDRLYTSGTIKIQFRDRDLRYIKFAITDEKTLNCYAWLTPQNKVICTAKDGQTVRVSGYLKCKYPYNTELVISTAEILDLENPLEQQCKERGFFDKEKTQIDFCKIRKMALFSKQGTEGYTDFVKQLGLSGIINITTCEIPLEGANTAPRLIESLREIKYGDCDIIMIVRGGGDIAAIAAAFDNLDLFQTMIECPIPIGVAIGHTNNDDQMMISKIADYNFHTPTTAAVTIKRAFTTRLESIISDIDRIVEKKHVKRIDKFQRKLEKAQKEWMEQMIPCPILRVDTVPEKVCLQLPSGLVFYRLTKIRSDTISITPEDIQSIENIELDNGIEEFPTIADPYKTWKKKAERWATIKAKQQSDLGDILSITDYGSINNMYRIKQHCLYLLTL